MSAFLRQYPVFAGGFLPDVLDAEGVPLLEGTSTRYPAYRDSVEYATSSYTGTRTGGRMNMTALSVVLRDRELWREAAVAFASIDQLLPEMTPLERLFRCASAYTHLPQVPYPPGPAATRQEAAASVEEGVLYKFFRGIRFACRFALLKNGHMDRLASFAEANDLLRGPLEVCPASSALIDAVESELLRILSTTTHSPSCGANRAVSAERLVHAHRISNLRVWFAACVAGMQALRRALGSPQAIRLPVPFVKEAESAAADGRHPEFIAGLVRLLRASREEHESWRDAMNFLGSVHAGAQTVTDAFDEVVRLGQRINAELLELESRPAEYPTHGAFRRTFETVAMASQA